MAASPPTTSGRPRDAARRRQRSVRVTVAVVLLALATLAVAGALAVSAAWAPYAAAVLTLALGWAALRIMWTEVLQGRRDNAAERAATAAAYRDLFDDRAAEHTEFTAVMTQRLAWSQMR